MTDGKLPDVPARLLRDHGTDARVERVWKRLRRDLGPARPRAAGAVLWAPAAFAAVFALGVFVGSNSAEREPRTTVMPEPQEIAEPVAAGERERERAPETDPIDPEPLPPRAVRGRAPVVDVEPAESVEEQPAPPVSQVVTVPVPLPEYQRLANLGEYAKAWQAVEALGGFDVVLGSATAEQLMILVDIARATGRRGRAVQALRRVTEGFPADPNAPIAAMTLGNMLHQAGDYAGAAAAYELNRRLSPKGDFAEDALARQFETAAEQAELEQARKLAEQYARDFPDGRRGEAIKRELARLEAEAGKQSEPGSTEVPVASEDPALDPGAE